MKRKTYLLFAFFLYQVYAAYPSVTVASQIIDYKYHDTVVDNIEETLNEAITSIETELNEEDDAKCALLNTNYFQLNFSLSFAPVLGKTLTSSPNKLLEPPCRG